MGNIYSFFLAPWSWCGSLWPLPAARLATSCWWEGMGNVGWKVCGPCQQEEVEGSRTRLEHRAERKALRDSSLRKDACQEQPVKRQGYDISKSNLWKQVCSFKIGGQVDVVLFSSQRVSERSRNGKFWTRNQLKSEIILVWSVHHTMLLVCLQKMENICKTCEKISASMEVVWLFDIWTSKYLILFEWCLLIKLICLNKTTEEN